MSLQEIAQQTVTGLGYDLVEIERSAAGLLRITIDLAWVAEEVRPEGAPEQFVTVEDCEKVTRQRRCKAWALPWMSCERRVWRPL